MKNINNLLNLEEKKISAITGIFALIESTRKINYTRACELSHDYLKNIRMGYGYEKVFQLDKLITLEDTVKQISREIGGLIEKYPDKNNWPEAVDDKFSDMVIGQDQIQDNIKILLEDKEISFLYHVSKFIGNLGQKKKEYFFWQILHQTSKESLLNTVNRIFPDLKLKITDISSIELTGWIINIVLSKSFSDKNFAICLADLPLSIRKNDENFSESIQRQLEYTILIGDLFPINNRSLSNRIIMEMRRLTRMIELESPSILIENSRRSIEKMIKYFVVECRKYLIVGLDDLLDGMLNAINRVANCANEFDEVYQWVKDNTSEKNRIYLEDLLEKSIDQFYQYSTGYFEDLFRVFFAAERLGLQKEAKAAFILYEANLTKVKRYLSNKNNHFFYYFYLTPLIHNREYYHTPDYSSDQRLILTINSRVAFDDLLNGVNLRSRSNYFFSYKNVTKFANLVKRTEGQISIMLTDNEINNVVEQIDDIDFYPLLETEGDVIMRKSVKYLHSLKLIFSRLDFLQNYDFSRIERFYNDFFAHLRSKN